MAKIQMPTTSDASMVPCPVTIHRGDPSGISVDICTLCSSCPALPSLMAFMMPVDVRLSSNGCSVRPASQSTNKTTSGHAQMTNSQPVPVMLTSAPGVVTSTTVNSTPMMRSRKALSGSFRNGMLMPHDPVSAAW